MRKKANTSKRYDREFKLGAVKLVVDEGRSCGDVAEDLGTTEASVRNWVDAYEKDQMDPFPGSGNPPSGDQGELERLREEVRILRMERDILKKTIGLFAERLK